MPTPLTFTTVLDSSRDANVIERCEVAVVGGGPVGLLLAARLAQCGVDVRVLERRTERSQESRAIGIHPPGLACLAQLGIADSLIQQGICVRRGQVFAGTRALGSISFATLPLPFNFVLTAPQHQTEALLEQRLRALAPHALIRGAELSSLTVMPQSVRLRMNHESTGERELEAAFVVGCDGKASAVRKAIQARYEGGPYRARFIMGDLPDDNRFGTDAAVFLTRSGLVESFPLPGAQRRWVASTGNTRKAADADILREIIAQRTDHTFQSSDCFMVNTFTAEHFLASQWVKDRLILAGDAAHVLSPIGGQGMNLGWLDAWSIARCLHENLREGKAYSRPLARYEATRMAAARSAIRRAELFMLIGRGFGWPALRDASVRALLSQRIAPHAARLFTMRGLATY